MAHPGLIWSVIDPNGSSKPLSEERLLFALSVLFPQASEQGSLGSRAAAWGPTAAGGSLRPAWGS